MSKARRAWSTTRAALPSTGPPGWTAGSNRASTRPGSGCSKWRRSASTTGTAKTKAKSACPRRRLPSPAKAGVRSTIALDPADAWAGGDGGMRRMLASLLVAALLAGPAGAQERAPGDYPLTADSLVQPGVAQGRLEGPFELRAALYPGTVRRYWVYVPHGYDPARPPNL